MNNSLVALFLSFRFIVPPLHCTQWGVSKIHVISVVVSEEGIKTIATTHPDVQLTVGTIDKEVNGQGALVPGIGDAGDRLFGTPMIDDDEELLHPSKRRKTSIDEQDVAK